MTLEQRLVNALRIPSPRGGAEWCCMNSDWLPSNAARPPWPMSLPSYLELLSDRLQSAAVDLRAQHVAEVGFRLQPALEAVDELAALDWAVLGGDVWQTGGSVPKPTYDNWHSDRGP